MYRLKTIDEFKSDGYAVTPAGYLIHAKYETVSDEMLRYGENLSQEVLRIVHESNGSRFVDCHIYHSFHITTEDLKLCK